MFSKILNNKILSPLVRHSSRKSLANTIPLNGRPMSNCMLNASRVQLIFTENNLPGSGDGNGGRLDQQPCKQITIKWYSTYSTARVILWLFRRTQWDRCKRLGPAAIDWRLTACGRSENEIDKWSPLRLLFTLDEFRLCLSALSNHLRYVARLSAPESNGPNTPARNTPK